MEDYGLVNVLSSQAAACGVYGTLFQTYLAATQASSLGCCETAKFCFIIVCTFCFLYIIVYLAVYSCIYNVSLTLFITYQLLIFVFIILALLCLLLVSCL